MRGPSRPKLGRAERLPSRTFVRRLYKDDLDSLILRRETKMKKMIRMAIFSLGMILLSAPLIHGQDLSKYRNFALGTSLANISKQIDGRPADTTVIHEHPGLIEELTWWPPQPYGPSRPAEP